MKTGVQFCPRTGVPGCDLLKRDDSYGTLLETEAATSRQIISRVPVRFTGRISVRIALRCRVVHPTNNWSRALLA